MSPLLPPRLKADFQSSHEAPRSSLRVHAWALSSNPNAKQLILIRCKHSQRAARSFVRGLEIRLNNAVVTNTFKIIQFIGVRVVIKRE
jgi:hypothetical protein